MVLSSKRFSSCAARSATRCSAEMIDGARDDVTDGFDGANELHSGVSANRGSNIF